jgi:hypothetical protein
MHWPSLFPPRIRSRRPSGLILLGLFSVFFFGSSGATSRTEPARALPPREAPASNGTPLVMSVGLYVTNLLAINEADESFEMPGYLTMQWRDDRLASEIDDPHARELREDEIWRPPVEIANAIHYQRYSHVIKVEPDGKVRYTERFSAELSDDFWLREFPFDTQALSLVLEPFLTRQMSVTFAPEDLSSGLSSATNVELAAWRLKDLMYVPGIVPVRGNIPQTPQARFNLLVSRRSGFYVWKVFLPMIVMTIIPWSAFWVDAREFDWQMKIPIATMLALVAFDFAISRDLPRVPYVTFLDAVFLVCFLFVFLSMVEIVGVHSLLKSKRARFGQKIHWHARWAVPVLFMGTMALLAVIFFCGRQEPV